jgi:hypothetical protein
MCRSLVPKLLGSLVEWVTKHFSLWMEALTLQTRRGSRSWHSPTMQLVPLPTLFPPHRYSAHSHCGSENVTSPSNEFSFTRKCYLYSDNYVTFQNYLSGALHLLWTFPAFSLLNLFTVGRTLGWRMRLSQRRYLHTEQHKHRRKANRHPCLYRVWNLWSQCLSRRRWSMP